MHADRVFAIATMLRVDSPGDAFLMSRLLAALRSFGLAGHHQDAARGRWSPRPLISRTRITRRPFVGVATSSSCAARCRARARHQHRTSDASRDHPQHRERPLTLDAFSADPRTPRPHSGQRVERERDERAEWSNRTGARRGGRARVAEHVHTWPGAAIMRRSRTVSATACVVVSSKPRLTKVSSAAPNAMLAHHGMLFSLPSLRLQRLHGDNKKIRHRDVEMMSFS